jgi:hypothetical protein
MISRPPRRAQWLIGVLVPRATRDSVLGDLLEEYTETQLPARGQAAADRWYMRQSLGFLWTAASPAGLWMAGNLTGRLMLDVVSIDGATPGQLAARAWVTTLIAMAIFAACGFRLGRSTGRATGAVPMAVAATGIATVAGYLGAFLLMAIATATSTAEPRVWGALNEGLDIPAHVIAVIGVVLATAGATIGRMFTGSSGSRASIRT